MQWHGQDFVKGGVGGIGSVSTLNVGRSGGF